VAGGGAMDEVRRLAFDPWCAARTIICMQLELTSAIQ